MKVLITGASSGIGLEMAKYLDEMGHSLVLVSRTKPKYKFKDSRYISLDLSILENNYLLFDKLKSEQIDFLICAAGFGTYGEFKKLELSKELNQIDLNIKSLVILNHLFINQTDKGYILNVSSLAAASFGPLMTTYYATKSYVFTHSISLKSEIKPGISVSTLIPGPTDTDFFKKSGMHAPFGMLDAKYVARYAIDKTLKKKLIIIPGIFMKIVYFFSKITPVKLLVKVNHYINKKKN